MAALFYGPSSFLVYSEISFVKVVVTKYLIIRKKEFIILNPDWRERIIKNELL